MMDAASQLDDQHPVRAAQRRIADSFATTLETDVRAPRGNMVSLVVPLLDALGWRGTPRQIAEAMPYEANVEDVEMLRAVLSRLGVDTPFARLKPHQIRARHCPCLLIDGPRDVRLVASVESSGHLRVFDPAVQAWATVKPHAVGAQVRLARETDMHLRQERLQQNGFIWPILKAFRAKLAIVFWQSFFINLLGLIVSLYVMYVYDKAIGTQSGDTLGMLALGVVLVLAVETTLRRRRAAVVSWIGARLDALVLSGCLRAVLGLPLAMSESAPLGAQLTRFRQFEIGRELFGGSLMTALVDLPFTLLFFGLIFALGGTLGFVPVVLAFLLVIIGVLTDPLVAKLSQEMAEWKQKSDTLLVEISTRRRTIKDDNAETIWLDRATESYHRYMSARFKSLQATAVLQSLTQSLVSIAGISVLGFGVLMVMHGTLTIGALIAVMAVVWRVLTPIQTVFLCLNRLRMTLQTVRQIEQLMKLKPERMPSRLPPTSQRIRGEIALTSACLRYGGRQELALRGVSMTIAPGEFITVTGSSGSGKSTLLKAILGVYPVQSGTVRLDGRDLRQLDPAETRHAIGYLCQEPTLFFGTIAQNLRLTAPDASRDELLAAFASMGIEPDHPALPDGLDTRFNAINRQAMSPAFIQRVALARMFVRPFPILLFDEPGTHLDREGDEALIASIQRLKGRCTIVMVTSRPSHMRLSDHVVVLHDGQVVGQGKPEDIVPVLLAQASKTAA
jgi:ABC-type bacteriocin/lantibiotic exporter with double-glycine peptidase domain